MNPLFITDIIFWNRGAKQIITIDDLAGYENTSYSGHGHTGLVLPTLTSTNQQFLKMVLKGKVDGILMLKKFNKLKTQKAYKLKISKLSCSSFSVNF